jgi:plasmid stabilization system protein ParE
MNVRLLAVAEAELDEAIAWYGRQAPGLGDAFLVELLRALRLIERHPYAWQALDSDIRRCRLTRFPYAILYGLEGSDIVVLAIAHMHRAPTYWRNRK